MPPAIPVIAAVAGAAAAKTSLGIIGGALIASLISTVGAMLFTRKPKAPSFDFTAEARDRSQIIRSSTTARRVIYGRAAVSGPLMFATSSGSRKEFLHLVVALAGHKVEDIGSVFLNDTEIKVSEIDGTGLVTEGKFANLVRVKKHLGTDDQAADSDLVSEAEEWTTDHRLRGIAYIYLRLEHNDDAFPTGIPNIRAVVKGKSVFDSRTATNAYTTNAALCIRDFLTDSNYGLGAKAEEIHDTSFNAAANLCEEYVETSWLNDTITANTNTNTLTLTTTSNPLGDGSRVWVSSTGTLPGGLTAATAYYVIEQGDGVFKLAASSEEAGAGTAIDITDSGTGTHSVTPISDTFTADETTSIFTQSDVKRTLRRGERVRLGTSNILPDGLNLGQDYFVIDLGATDFKLATSMADAVADNAVAVIDAGTGTHTISVQAQLRYDMNGTINVDEKPVEVLEGMLTAMAGALVYTQGQYRLYGGGETTASADVDETWLRGPIRVRPRISRKELFNAVRGTFVDPAREWQPTDFPPVENPTYETQDGGEQFVRDIDLPHTTDAVRAQRLAKIHLEKGRQGITVEMPCNLKALPTGVWDVVRLKSDKFGWPSSGPDVKEFRIIEWKLTDDLGVDLVLQEESSEAYDWDLGDATDHDPAPDTNLQPAGTVNPPGLPQITEELYATSSSGGIKTKAIVSWAEAPDAYVETYQLDYKTAAASEWIPLPRTFDTKVEVLDIAAGIYDFRVKAINRLRISSIYMNRFGIEILALSAPPPPPQNMTLQAVGGMAIIQWTPSTQLDVKIGGRVEFRHSRATSGATWQTSSGIGKSMGGSTSLAMLPLKPGTYLAKFVDSSGIASTTPSTVVNTGSTILDFTSLGTISEHTTFSGSHTDTVANGGVLMLRGDEPIDNWGLVDSVDDWDAEDDIVSSGTYEFATGFDFGVIKRVRLTTDPELTFVNMADNIDLRSTIIDTWDDFDGDNAASGDITISLRHTEEDPTVTQTWSEWIPFDQAEFQARAFEFKCELTSFDPDYNVHVSQLTVNADEVTP